MRKGGCSFNRFQQEFAFTRRRGEPGVVPFDSFRLSRFSAVIPIAAFGLKLFNQPGARGRMGIRPVPGLESVVQPLVPWVELFSGSSPGLIQMMKDLNRTAAL